VSLKDYWRTLLKREGVEDWGVYAIGEFIVEVSAIHSLGADKATP